MNKKLRQFEKQSGLDIYGLGARREIWDKAMEKYAKLIIQDCIEINKQELSFTAFERLMNKYQENFGVEEYSAQPDQEADAFIAAENKKVASRYGYFPKLHPSEWKD